MFLTICGWVGFIVLCSSVLQNMINTFRGKDVKDRVSSFIACIISSGIAYFIGMKLFS